MSYYVDAIYDHGMLKPLEPLAIPDQSRVRLTVDVDQAPRAAEDGAAELRAEIARQRQAARELSEILANIPDRSPQDGFTSADHDKVLYGGPAGPA